MAFSEWGSTLDISKPLNMQTNADIYLHIIEELEVAGGLRGPLDGLAQCHCTGATLGPVGAAHSIKRPRGLGHAADQIQLSLGVCPAGRASTDQKQEVRDKQKQRLYFHPTVRQILGKLWKRHINLKCELSAFPSGDVENITKPGIRQLMRQLLYNVFIKINMRVKAFLR